MTAENARAGGRRNTLHARGQGSARKLLTIEAIEAVGAKAFANGAQHNTILVLVGHKEVGSIGLLYPYRT